MTLESGLMNISKIVEKSKASQNRTELTMLLNILSQYKIKNVLEIGMGQGHSMKVWEQAFHPDILVGVDAVQGITPPPHHGKSILGDSTALDTVKAVTTAFKNQPIDFLFIDGGHDPLTVETDYFNYGKLVRSGGVIAFHDVSIRDHPTDQVHLFWDVIKLKSAYVEFRFHGGTGTGVIFV